MKHYELTVNNGDYPLTRTCSTIAEAYGCLETLRTGLLHHVDMDMDEIMELLVNMRNGKHLSHSQHGWGIRVWEDEP